MRADLHVDQTPSEQLRRLTNRIAVEMDQSQDGSIFRRQLPQRPFQHFGGLPFRGMVAKGTVRLSGQRLFDPAFVCVAQSADGHLVAILNPPKIVAGADGDAGQPVAEGNT